MKKKQRPSKAAAQPVRDLGLKASRVGRHVKRATAGGPKADQKREAEERERVGAEPKLGAHVAKERSRFPKRSLGCGREIAGDLVLRFQRAGETIRA